MAYGYPSATGSYLPTAVDRNLLIGFSRNVRDYPILRYASVAPTPKQVAFYPYIKTAVGFRVLQRQLQDRVWNDGDPRPEGEQNRHAVEWRDLRVRRYDYGTPIGGMAANQADYDVINVQAGLNANMAMTGRTVLFLEAFKASVTAGDISTATATALVGGMVGTGTSTDPRLKKLFNYVTRVITQATYGSVKRGDIIAIFRPDVATTITESAEIHDYLKGSPFSLNNITGDKLEQNANANWGLPPTLYGMKIQVEDSVEVTSPEGQTETRDWVMEDKAIMFISRPGGLEFNVGKGTRAPMNFSSICMFEGPMQGRDTTLGMASQVFWDSYNELHKIHVVDNVGVETTAPASSFSVTGAIA